MENPKKNVLKNRYEALLMADVIDGNPNGDPDNAGQPRVDPITNHGYITDVCIKRKVRDYIVLADPTQELYVKKKAILANQQARAYSAVGMEAPPEESEDEVVELEVEPEAPSKGPKKKANGNGKKQADLEAIRRAVEFMCNTFWDIRAFGAVFAGKGEKAMGQLTGPIQMSFATSVDPVRVREERLTRVAVATVRESLEQGGNINQTMGAKYVVPYGLYVAKIFISPHRAQQTGFTEDDLSAFWKSLDLMWDHDRSASRGYMAMRKLIIFKHASALGNASSRDLFDRVSVKRKAGVDMASSFQDYDVNVNLGGMPAGIEVMTFPR